MPQASKNIVLFDGRQDDGDTNYADYLQQVKKSFEQAGYRFEHIKVGDHKLKQCSGCFDCWIKTPGQCVCTDDGDQLRAAWLRADLVILASPLYAGFASALLKKLVDKFLPLAHPYIEIYQGEMKHRLRYDGLPPMACIFAPGPKDHDDDIAISVAWVARVVDQVREALVFGASPKNPVDGLVQKVEGYFGQKYKAPKALPWPRPQPIPQLDARPGPHKLLVINGSPRARSNTTLLIEHIKSGFEQNAGNSLEAMQIHTPQRRQKALHAWNEADLVLFALPLYVHAMPSHLKLFIETLETTTPRPQRRVGFLIQSGFSEAHHSRWLEAYLARLPKRWGAEYMGTLVRGGVEGIRIQPKIMTQKVFDAMQDFGRKLGRSARIDPKVVQHMAPHEGFSKRNLLLLAAMKKTGVLDMFWNSQLKKNGVFEQRFARPLDVTAK